MAPTAPPQPATRTRKRAELGEQVRLLAVALEGFRINHALPYTAQVFGALKAAILHNRLPPGTPLSEAAVAEVLALSRTPVREALKDLSMEHLLDIFPQAGSVVAPIRLSRIEQGSFVRETLETANLLELVERLDEAGGRRVRQVIEQQQQALADGDRHRFFEHDEAMHRLYFELNGRASVWEIVTRAKQHVDRARLFVQADAAASKQLAYDDHLRIHEALLARDREALRAELHHHLSRAKANALSYIGQSHPLFVAD